MIRHSFDIPVPADLALAAHRDGLPHFGSSLPGLSSVTLESRERQGTADVLRHHWQGDLAMLPTPVRRMVSKEQVCWRDHGRWDPVQGTGTWEIHIPVLGAGPHVRGTHHFQDEGDHTRVTVEAELTFVAGAHTTVLGVPVGRWMAPLLTAAVRGVFERILTHSGAVVTAWVQDLETERKAA